MIDVSLVVLAQQKKISLYLSSWQTRGSQSANQNKSRRFSFRSSVNDPSTDTSESQVHDSLALYQSSRMRKNKISEQVVHQAITFCTIHTIINGSILSYGILKMHGPSTFTVDLLFSLIFPLQGVLNVFALTRPFVLTLLRRNREYSWLKAFWTIIKSGGDEDQLCFRRRRSSVRRTSNMLQQHVSAMEIAVADVESSSNSEECNVAANERLFMCHDENLMETRIKEASRESSLG